jgi:hypothetical protein
MAREWETINVEPGTRLALMEIATLIRKSTGKHIERGRIASDAITAYHQQLVAEQKAKRRRK